MTIEVHLYGSLRRYAPDPRPDRECVVRFTPGPEETIETVLERLGIPAAELGHVFLNGSLLATCNAMAPWLRYQQAQANVFNRERALDILLGANDRLGLFPREMAMLVV
ncbi:MAG: hypothetical protein NUW24_04830 [Anaerolineae bacterium]|jgi:hypothetical protein|nr:hypothetical protein [Anaerolineae bacterium]MDH7473920.1 hypothetical protein [Anaerolineae bacterium]